MALSILVLGAACGETQVIVIHDRDEAGSPDAADHADGDSLAEASLDSSGLDARTPDDVLVAAVDASESGTPDVSDARGAEAGGPGGAVLLATSPCYARSGLGQDTTYLYWACEGSGTLDAGVGDGAIYRVAKTGGSVQTVATGQYRPWYVVSDGTNAYWTTYGKNPGPVMRAAVTGGAASVFDTVGAFSSDWIAVRGTVVYWLAQRYRTISAKDTISNTTYSILPTTTPGTQTPATFTLDISYIYWSNNSDIDRGPISGISCPSICPTIIAAGETSGGGLQGNTLVNDSRYVYWTIRGGIAHDGQIRRWTKPSGPTDTIVPAQAFPYEVAADPIANFIYWSSGDSGETISRFQTIGIPFVQVVAQNQNYVRGLILDADAVYWISGFGEIKAQATH